jgi:hypothetical protein
MDLYQMFAPVRDSLRDRTEDEINRAIDEAIAGARNYGPPAANVGAEE